MRAACFIACFGSIWTLLGFLYGIAPMHWLGVGLLLPSMAWLLGSWWWAARGGDEALAEAFWIGSVGGLWGTLGYDLIRVPLHFLGLNPFAPIRSYGMYLTNAPESLWWSDLAGALYHFSNGWSFGVMYALVMRGRHVGWAVVFALVLETFAYGTAYGTVYGLRTAPMVLAIAYFAHLYYGLPLGWVVADPARARAAWQTPWKRAVTAALTVSVIAVLVGGWPRHAEQRPGRLHASEATLTPGWLRVPVGQTVHVDGLESGVLISGDKALGTGPLRFDQPGLVPIQVQDGSQRSMVISVELDGFPR